MNTFYFLLLIIAHIICGLGVVAWFRIKMNPFLTLSLSTIIGIVIHSTVPIVQDILGISLTAQGVAWGIIIITMLFSSGLIWGRKSLIESLKNQSFSIKVYEIPFLTIISFAIYVAAYRCYYFPVTPRDALSGPEAIAEFAVREGKIANSFFNVNLETTNNQFKSPYLIGLQIVYKFLVQPFGQVWLIPLVISFILFLYTSVRERIHPILGGLFVFLFIATPECFAYTIMILYDYSNMVFFAVAAYMLYQFRLNRRRSELWLAALLFGMATYIRTETLILVGLLFPLFFMDGYKTKKLNFLNLMIPFGILMSFSLLFYILVMKVYLPVCIPEKYILGKDLNQNWGDIGFLFKRFVDVNEQLIFGERGIQLWNYFMYLFLLFVIANIMIYKKQNKEESYWLYMVGIVYFGIPLLGYIIPLVDVANTSKRSLFKILPLMFYYMVNTRLIAQLSNLINQFGAKPKLKS